MNMKEIQLSQGYVSKVDDEDFEYLSQWKWTVTKNGSAIYARRSIHVKGKSSIKVYMHRAILKLTDSKILVDHKDRDGLNNQKINLRACSKTDNQRNQSKKVNTGSIYKGVSWHRKGKKWAAAITNNYKPIHLGLFSSEKDAAEAYNKAAKNIYGEFANPNIL